MQGKNLLPQKKNFKNWLMKDELIEFEFEELEVNEILYCFDEKLHEK
jgi:hypothetical protein